MYGFVSRLTVNKQDEGNSLALTGELVLYDSYLAHLSIFLEYL